MVIKPTYSTKNRTFAHAGQIPARFDQHDPRQVSFEEKCVDIDLRECGFLLPAAALWCVVYGALAAKRGAQCRFLVPQNYGVCAHLKSTGLFGLLKAHGVDVDDRNVRSHPDPKVVLPTTHFVTTADAEKITNVAFDNLRSADLAGGNLTPVVTELFSELAQNAAQHSESEIGAFACIQFLEAGNNARFTCAVADGGIGVRQSLLKNPDLRGRISYDWDALELAVLERVSGTGDPHRGIGLFGVREDLRSPGRTLLLHSGLGSLQIRKDLQSEARRTRLFPGTLAYLTIPA